MIARAITNHNFVSDKITDIHKAGEHIDFVSFPKWTPYYRVSIVFIFSVKNSSICRIHIVFSRSCAFGGKGIICFNHNKYKLAQ